MQISVPATINCFTTRRSRQSQENVTLLSTLRETVFEDVLGDITASVGLDNFGHYNHGEKSPQEPRLSTEEKSSTNSLVMRRLTGRITTVKFTQVVEGAEWTAQTNHMYVLCTVLEMLMGE